MPSNRELSFLMVYLLVALLQLTGEFFKIEWLGHTFKILLMPALAAYLLFNTDRSISRMAILIALTCAWGGDILLINGDKKIFFLMGMAAFFGTQIMYALSFFQTGANVTIAKWPKIITASLIIAFSMMLFVQIAPRAGDMAIFIMSYTISIVFMAVVAIFRFGNTSSNSFWIILSGALLFIISDTLIGINKFLIYFEAGHFLVMFTYIAAQGLIIYGYRLHRSMPSRA